MRTRYAILIGALGAALAFATGAGMVHLPPPFATPSADNRPTVVPKPANAQLTVPAGFHIGVWQSGFDVPRFLLLGPENEVLVADSAEAPNGAIYVIRNNQRKKLIGHLNRPFGLALWNGYLYVGEPTSIRRYHYDSKAETADRGEQVISLAGLSEDHWTRPLLFDREGKKLYVGVGSGSNDSPGEDPRRAAINRYNPDGSGHEIFASGTRNPNGLAWYPGTDTLWASVQERDTLGDNIVPDFITHIQEGGFYGWPYAYIGPHPDPFNGKKRPDLVAKTITPDFLLPAHVAVIGIIFYTGSQFPAHYKNGAILAFHGSWNRAQRDGYSVTFVPFQNGKPSGQIQPLVTGWMLSPQSRDVWGRPVGLLQMPDGSVLISDDGGKKIWRLSYGG